MKQTKAVYEKFVLVNLAFSSYSGMVTLDKKTLGSNIDPALYSAGELKTVSREKLNVFGSLKAKARTSCLRYGTSFMGGYAIPIEKWVEVKQELEDIKIEYKTEANRFVSNYESYVKEWAEEYPDGGDLVIQKAHEADWIASRFPANFFGCTLSPASGMEDSMDEHVDGMFTSICKDISNDAKQAIRGHLKGSNITNKMRGTFENMLEKIKALSFINSSLIPLGETISSYINSYFPADIKGKIQKSEQNKIALILVAMSDPENLPNLAEILQAEEERVEKTTNQKSSSEPSFEKNTVTTLSKDVVSAGYNAGFSLM
jgi:hypothetical protein